MGKRPESYKKLNLSHQSIVDKIENEYNGSVPRAAEAMDIPYRTLYRWYTEPQKKNLEVKRFVITYAQNATPVHEGFFLALQRYCVENKAELIAFKGKYKNPTSQWERDNDSSYWWDSSLHPYLMDTNRKLNENVMIYSARTQPTAVNPLSGYETHTGPMSGIFPHPKIRLQTVPTPGHMMPKILTTTGAITIKNYSDSKAGKKGEHHHILGALVVEVKDEKVFFMRHINAKSDGSFFDVAGGICREYTADKINEGHRLDAVVFGDIHYPFVDESALSSGLSLVNTLNPKRLYVHDLADFYRRNHHDRGNRFLNHAKSIHDMINVEDEMRGTAEILAKVSNPEMYETVVVRANHDEALERWLQEEKLDNLGENAKYFHWLSYHKHKSATKRIYGFEFHNSLKFALSEFMNFEEHGVRWLKRDEAEIFLDIDYGMHGDVGGNGARGSANNLSKIGVKSVIGHSHSPSIVNGVYQVGVKAIIPMSYARGASGWLHTDCITYPNGKRTLIHHINGEWCLK